MPAPPGASTMFTAPRSASTMGARVVPSFSEGMKKSQPAFFPCSSPTKNERGGVRCCTWSTVVSQRIITSTVEAPRVLDLVRRGWRRSS